MNEFFRKFSARVTRASGSAWAFVLALASVLGWAVTGPLFHYSENWQLVINTSTTIITFLMVFLIQNGQNRDAKAMHLKLDELLHGLKGSHLGFIDVEELSDKELEALERAFRKLRARYGLSLDEFIAEVEREELAEAREKVQEVRESSSRTSGSAD